MKKATETENKKILKILETLPELEIEISEHHVSAFNRFCMICPYYAECEKEPIMDCITYKMYKGEI